MKVKVCPECGKHNMEDTWNCGDCGSTLSMKTLVDTESHHINDGPLVYFPELSNISTFLHEDVAEFLDITRQRDESIIRGANITQPSGGAPFRFGYVILTSQRFICVLFESELKRDKIDTIDRVLEPLSIIFGIHAFFYHPPWLPKRAYRVMSSSPTSRSGVVVLESLSAPLTPKEEASRVVIIHKLKDLVSVNLRWVGGLLSLKMELRWSRDLTVSFYSPHEAKDIYKSLKYQAQH